MEKSEEANAVLAAIVESSGDAIIAEDLSGKITYWNKAAEKLFGFSAEAVIGRSLHSFVPPESFTAEAELLDRHDEGEPTDHFDTVRLRKDGTKVHVSVTISPITDAAGRTIGRSQVMRDITARKTSERELRRRTEELNAFLETAQIGIHRVGPDGTILWANAAELHMLGYRAEEYIGHHIEKFHADETAINEILGTLGGGEKLYEYEARLRCKDGSIKHVLIDSSVHWKDGCFIHTQCFTRDISQRKRADDELREAKLLAEQTLERITDGFFAVDTNWRLTFINRYAAEVFGRMRPAHEFLGQNLWESFPGLSGTVLEREYRRAMAEQVATKFELHYAPLKGWFDVSAYPSRDGLSIYFKEITARKELEQSLHESQQLLRGIIDNTPAVVYVKDFEGRYLLINRRYSELHHITPEAIAGKTDHDVFAPEVADKIREFDRRVIRADAPIVDEEETPLDDGSHTFISVKCPLRDQAGKSYAVFGISTDITERKRMEETLRESEERFRTLADNIAQFTWMADGKGWIFWYNKRWFEYTGTTLEEMQGWGWQKVHHPGHVKRVVEKIRHAFETGEYWEDIFPLRAKDGTYRWFLSRAIPVRNAQGEVVRWLGTNTDITEQRQAEAALAAERDRAEESERLFRAFVTASSDVVYRMNADWTEMRRLEGKAFISDTPDPSRSWLKKYIHPEDQPRVLNAINEAIREKKNFELEHRVFLVDGSLGWTFSRAIPLLDERGEIIEWFGAALDITERKRAEEALQRLTEKSEHERRLYDTLLSSTPDQTCVFGLDRRFIYVNPALLGTLGRSREQVIGKTCSEAGFEPEQAANHDREIAQVIATKHAIRGEVAYAGANGRRIYDYLFVPVLGTHGQVEAVGGSMRDITDQKRIAENLERVVAERTVKLRETIGELEAFSYSIAHDMRAPLRSLQGYSEVLLSEHSSRLEPDGREFLQRIGTAAKRMDRLIRDVLNYSRIVRSELALERVSLEPLLRDIVETYPMFAPDGAEIEIAGPFLPALGNEAMLTQVFSNLLGNAVKFVAPGTRPRIKIWAEPRDARVRVFVQDNGIGIAEDQHRKIFEVFQQAATGFGGTGIGLAIVQKAIERMGGDVGVRSTPGQGSTFWIDIARA